MRHGVPPGLGLLLAAGGIAACLLFVLCVIAGTQVLPAADVVRVLCGGEAEGGMSARSVRNIVANVRIPRAVGALSCGAGLSVAGLLLQSSLNNALASPGILGVNSGAGLFVLLGALAFPYSAYIRAACAFAGALLAVLIVYLVSIKAGVSRTSLVLAGVAASSLMGAGIDVIITFRPEVVADKVAFALGGFQSIAPMQAKVAACIIALGICAAALLAGGIDLFPLGDDAAYGLGLNVKRHRLLAVLVAALLAAASVSVCGLLGFVGLIVPNVVRQHGAGRCRAHIALCVLWGGAFLLLCDLLARVLFFPYEVPVGLFLSCLGAPFFIGMLVRRRRRLDS